MRLAKKFHPYIYIKHPILDQISDAAHLPIVVLMEDAVLICSTLIFDGFFFFFWKRAF